MSLQTDNLYNHGIDMELVRNLVMAVKKGSEFTDFNDHEL